jgi:hypothetical protein
MADVTSAFWLYNVEARAWKLIIASPKVATEGPLKYYKRIDDANNLAKEDEEVISLHDISAVDTNKQIVKLFKIAVNTGNAPSKGIRFYRNAINGTYIEDSYIYRST